MCFVLWKVILIASILLSKVKNSLQKYNKILTCANNSAHFFSFYGNPICQRTHFCRRIYPAIWFRRIIKGCLHTISIRRKYIFRRQPCKNVQSTSLLHSGEWLQCNQADVRICQRSLRCVAPAFLFMTLLFDFLIRVHFCVFFLCRLCLACVPFVSGLWSSMSL